MGYPIYYECSGTTWNCIYPVFKSYSGDTDINHVGFYDVLAIDTDNVWIVGGGNYVGGEQEPVIFRKIAGGAFAVDTTLNAQYPLIEQNFDAKFITGTSNNDIYITVTYYDYITRDSIFHWDGLVWTKILNEATDFPGVIFYLGNMSMTSTEVYVSGYTEDYQSLVLKYNFNTHTWAIEYISVYDPDISNSLNGIFITDKHNGPIPPPPAISVSMVVSHYIYPPNGFSDMTYSTTIWDKPTWKEDSSGIPVPIGDNVMDSWITSSCWHDNVHGVTCFGREQLAEYTVYVPAVQIYWEMSPNLDIPYMMAYDGNTTVWSADVLPTSGDYRVFQTGGISGCIISNIAHMCTTFTTCDTKESGDPDANFYCVTYIYNDDIIPFWSMYKELIPTTITIPGKTLTVNNSGTAKYFQSITDSSNSAAIALFNSGTSLWNSVYVPANSYDWLITDLNGTSYSNVWVISYKDDTQPLARLHHFNGSIWSYFECATLFGTFAPNSIAVTDTNTMHLVGSNSLVDWFNNYGIYWYYDGASWTDLTSTLPLPFGETNPPMFCGIRAKTDNWIVLTAYSFDTWSYYIYKCNKGVWSIQKMQNDETITASLGSNIYVGTLI